MTVANGETNLLDVVASENSEMERSTGALDKLMFTLSSNGLSSPGIGVYGSILQGKKLLSLFFEHSREK